MWDFDKYRNQTAVVTEYNETLSYADLSAMSRDLAQIMTPRSLLVHLCRNDLGSFVGYVTCIQNKVVPILLNAQIAPEALQEFIDRYRPEFIYAPSEREILLPNSEVIYTKLGYSLLRTNLVQESSRLHDDLALLLTTSGSTGSPKLIRLSYKNIASNAASIAEYLELTLSERTITSLPMNYSFGLSIINSYLLMGASLVLTSSTIMQKEFWEIFRKFNVTSLSGVPYTFSMLDKLQFMKMSFPSLKVVTQAGGKLSAQLHQKFATWASENGKKFIVMYGQTEATARMSYLPFDQSLGKIGSIGIPIPGGEFEIRDAEGNPVLDPDLPGELVYKGENVALGYAELESDLSLGDVFNGQLETGDLGKKDRDGFIYIVGRKKRFLKIFGNRVSLDEVENIIKDHFKIDDCACCGRDDKMFIFLHPADAQKEVIAYISKYTSLHPTAFKVIVIESLPKSDAGKILYKELENYCD